MRLFTIIVSCMFLLAASDAPERFEWSEGRLLQWSDFKGAPDSLESWAASSSTGMSQGYEANSEGFINKEAVVVKAYFYTDYSWVRHSRKSRHLLGHEQTHFDITEVYARKLQKLVKETVFTSNGVAELKALYNQIEQERVATQKLFDKESEHSLNHQEEIKWELKVKRWLQGELPE